MPIVFEKKEKEYSIGIWHSTEAFSELLQNSSLNESDLQKWTSIQSEKRKREWLTVRVLLKTLFQKEVLPMLSYDTFGKPYLNNGMGISISHTREFIAIIITSKASAGIDIETLRERITVLSAKFTNEEEQKFIPEFQRIEYLHVLWGGKEVLFKLYGKGELDFRVHLHVEPFQYKSEGEITAWIRKDSMVKKHIIHHAMWNGMMLAYSVSD